jgi:hypothetical protein
MRIVLACLVILGCLLGQPENASAFTLIGAGVDSCGTWTADRRHPSGSPALQDGEWVLGFLSGIGYEGAASIDPLQGVDAQAVLAWVDNYCQVNPLDKISDAAKAFYKAHPHK